MSDPAPDPFSEADELIRQAIEMGQLCNITRPQVNNTTNNETKEHCPDSARNLDYSQPYQSAQNGPSTMAGPAPDPFSETDELIRQAIEMGQPYNITRPIVNNISNDETEEHCPDSAGNLDYSQAQPYQSAQNGPSTMAGPAPDPFSETDELIRQAIGMCDQPHDITRPTVKNISNNELKEYRPDSAVNLDPSQAQPCQSAKNGPSTMAGPAPEPSGEVDDYVLEAMKFLEAMDDGQSYDITWPTVNNISNKELKEHRPDSAANLDPSQAQPCQSAQNGPSTMAGPAPKSLSSELDDHVLLKLDKKPYDIFWAAKNNISYEQLDRDCSFSQKHWTLGILIGKKVVLHGDRLRFFMRGEYWVVELIDEGSVKYFSVISIEPRPGMKVLDCFEPREMARRLLAAQRTGDIVGSDLGTGTNLTWSMVNLIRNGQSVGDLHSIRLARGAYENYMKDYKARLKTPKYIGSS
ncbi:MAG: hypothetical protein L6R40_007608 [Gallowayella cf. fulva]|nr:MAG: hypothetical protein L6R40_007608 [Xanthomendoza cf. fulva]